MGPSPKSSQSTGEGKAKILVDFFTPAPQQHRVALQANLNIINQFAACAGASARPHEMELQNYLGWRPCLVDGVLASSEADSA
jgi:hypothetical protein